MKQMRLGIAVGLVVALGACSNMMGGGSNASSRTTMAVPPTVAPDMVRQVQAKLRDGGYYKQGSVDGVWGSGTEAAVRSFQQDHNMSASGQLDVPTLQALNLAGGPPASSTAATNNPANIDTRPTQPMRTDANVNSPPTDNTAAPPPR